VVELPPNVRGGNVTVSQDSRMVSRIDLPPVNQATISIPLAGAEVVGNAVTVMLRSQLLPPEGYCLVNTDSPMRLDNAVVAFTGREVPPRVVAEFLPPILQKLTLFVPGAPTVAESAAAVRLTTAVVARYGKQALDVDLAPLDGPASTPPEASQPLQRQIVIREGPDAGVSLQGSVDVPTLLITGSGNDLTNQVRLLTADLSRLALASKAVAGPLKSSAQLPGNRTTIRDLGQPGVNAVALKPQVAVALDQTRLGRPVHGVRVQLKGSYTPLPANVGGQVVASVGGQTIDRWPVESDGVIDRWIDVPDDLLQRYTNLGIAIDISGDTGSCGQFQPVTLTIDGATAVETSAANPPVPAGFQSMPQALMPRAAVGIGPDAFADTARAVNLMEGLQRLSALPLDTEVMPLQQAIDSGSPAVLIAADGWEDQRIQLPVGSGGDGALDVQPLGDDAAATTITLDPGQQFGSVQTVLNGSRSVLVATSNSAPAQLDSLLEWLDQDQRRWPRLSGTAVVSVPDQAPVVVNSATAADDSAPAVVEDASPRWWIAAAAVAVAVLVLGIGLLLLRRRRRTAGN
jgi:hypothetical protein